MIQIAWFEVVLKGGLGAALILVPFSTLRLLGWHRDARRFWPRMAGLLLAGIAAGTAAPLLFPRRAAASDLQATSQSICSPQPVC